MRDNGLHAPRALHCVALLIAMVFSVASAHLPPLQRHPGFSVPPVPAYTCTAYMGGLCRDVMGNFTKVYSVNNTAMEQSIQLLSHSLVYVQDRGAPPHS